MDELACSASHEVDCSTPTFSSPRYRAYVLAAFVVGLVVISPMALLLPLEKGMWTYARWSLGDERVVAVTVTGADAAQRSLLEGEAAGEAARAFFAGSFSQSNRDGRGPEPQAHLSIDFSSGQKLEAALWPDGRFEVSERGRNYLVSSPGLLRVVQEQVALH